jgi:hypothetical protein
MRKLLITLPDHDDATFYISCWSKFIIEEGERKGVKILRLNREKSNRKTLFSFLKTHDPKFLILNGHGDEKAIYGYNDEKIVEKGDEEIFKQKIVYTIACDAAKSLGESIVKKGGECFIGYREKFEFFIDEGKITNPLEDEKAASFFNATNKIPIGIIKGNSTVESVEKAKKEFRKEIIKWRLSKEPEAPFILFALVWDLNSLTHLGEETIFE